MLDNLPKAVGSIPSGETGHLAHWQMAAAPKLRSKPVHRPGVGLIELTMKVAMASEMRRFFEGTSAGIYATRVSFSGVTNPHELGSMEGRVQTAAGNLPDASWMHVIVYGCTSGRAVIGHDRLAKLIGEIRPGIPVVTPIGEVSAALKALGAKKIAAATPYTMEVNRVVEGTLRRDEYEIASAC